MVMCVLFIEVGVDGDVIVVFLLLMCNMIIFSVFFCCVFGDLIGDFCYIVVVVGEFNVVERYYYCSCCFIQFFNFCVIWKCDSVMFVFGGLCFEEMVYFGVW